MHILFPLAKKCCLHAFSFFFLLVYCLLEGLASFQKEEALMTLLLAQLRETHGIIILHFHLRNSSQKSRPANT